MGIGISVVVLVVDDEAADVELVGGPVLVGRPRARVDDVGPESSRVVDVEPSGAMLDEGVELVVVSSS